MQTFKTKVDLDFYEAKDKHGDFDVLTQTVEITWELQLEMRSWGVKGISMYVPPQKITVTLSILGDEEDTEKELTFDLSDVVVEKQSESLDHFFPTNLMYNEGEWTLVY